MAAAPPVVAIGVFGAGLIGTAIMKQLTKQVQYLPLLLLPLLLLVMPSHTTLTLTPASVDCVNK